MTWLLKALLSTLLAAGKNIVAALVTRKMVLWALTRFAASTKTQVDDYAVQLIAGGLNNDPQVVQKAVAGLADAWLPDQRTSSTHER